MLRKRIKAISVNGVLYKIEFSSSINAFLCNIIKMEGFTSFKNTKELACYCGVAPFIKKRSGISVRSKPGASPFANIKLKWLLHLCALSAVRHDAQLKSYYERKVAEDKNKMSVINGVRNKLVLRMFALLRDDRYYVENYQRNCA